ncbi:hypothetical protein Bhyg_06939 [Pseudolycoriella hygida]|uniref:Uncharacterized protein n=1 Tax=Pseudolycoriella hygida TaxID=35572 RepID=A0A9Q0N3L2_9DIPT|nr:hypothetical protein Bhyg_06939 [Pseudolycoriella hygida]
MKCFYILVFLLLIQSLDVLAKKKKNGSGSDSRSGNDSGSSSDSGSKSGSNESSSGSKNRNRKDKKHKKEPKKPPKPIKPNKNSSKNDSLENILVKLPSPLNNIATSVKISINSITTSLVSISSLRSSTLSNLSLDITAIFNILSKVTGVSNLITSIASVFEKISLTFTSLETGFGNRIVGTAKKAIVDIQTTLSGLLLLISSQSSLSNIDNFVKNIAENIQFLISFVDAITSLVSTANSAFTNLAFEAVFSLQLIMSTVFYAIQWVFSLTASTSFSRNVPISETLTRVTLAVSTILQTISKIIVNISNVSVSGSYSNVVNLISSSISQLSSSVNTSLRSVSGTTVNVVIRKEEITSSTCNSCLQ